jgi:hypothetical protein
MVAIHARPSLSELLFGKLTHVNLSDELYLHIIVGRNSKPGRAGNGCSFAVEMDLVPRFCPAEDSTFAPFTS